MGDLEEGGRARSRGQRPDRSSVVAGALERAPVWPETSSSVGAWRWRCDTFAPRRRARGRHPRGVLAASRRTVPPLRRAGPGRPKRSSTLARATRRRSTNRLHAGLPISASGSRSPSATMWRVDDPHPSARLGLLRYWSSGDGTPSSRRGARPRPERVRLCGSSPVRFVQREAGSCASASASRPRLIPPGTRDCGRRPPQQTRSRRPGPLLRSASPCRAERSADQSRGPEERARLPPGARRRCGADCAPTGDVEAGDARVPPRREERVACHGRRLAGPEGRGSRRSRPARRELDPSRADAALELAGQALRLMPCSSRITSG